MRSRAKLDVNVVDFPPPVSDGQKWKWRIAAQLLLKKKPSPEAADALIVGSEDYEAISVVGLVIDVIKSCSQRGWQREQQAAYVISMLPEDREAALKFIRELSCENDE